MARMPGIDESRPLVIPSSMRFGTPLMYRLVERNPYLARDVIAALNAVDRGRNRLYRQCLGDIRVRR